MKKMNVYLCQFNIETPSESQHEFMYFPYSVGVLWANATLDQNIMKHFALKEFLIKKEPIEDIVNSLDNPAVFGFSSFVWNHQYNVTLAKAIKKKFPSCIIFFGGPSVPYQDENFLKENNFIDFVIYREGELAFVNLLNHILGKEVDMGSIGYLEENTLKTFPCHRIVNLDDIPSPYTLGLFDDLIKKYKGTKVVLNAIIETNRGCPFGCTFCDWGNLEFGKVKKVGIHRVKQELEWMAKNEVELVSNADANFGIFKDRDVEIAEYMVQLHNKYNYPQIFDTNWNKVFTESLLDIVRPLTEKKLVRRFMASFQSLNELTGKAIKRKNISLENFYKIFKICEENDVNIATELILPLPEETYDSFVSTLERFHDLGIVATVNLLTMLPNAEMSSPEYRKKYGIITQTNQIGDSPYVKEVVEKVIGTNSMSVKEFEKASTITFLMEHLNSSGFCDVVCRYISKQKNIKLTDVYYSLYEYFVGNSSTVLYSHFQILVDHVEQRNTEKLLEGIQFIGMFNDIGDYQRNKFLQELDTFMKTYDVFQTEDVIKLQNHKQKHFGQESEYEILMDTNVFEYLYANENLKKQQNVYVVKNSGIEKKFKTYGNFIVSSRLNQNWKTKVVKK
jgi:radical SAM superfamily enzyme YgiQ (UPF0313 family)